MKWPRLGVSLIYRMRNAPFTYHFPNQISLLHAKYARAPFLRGKNNADEISSPELDQYATLVNSSRRDAEEIRRQPRRSTSPGPNGIVFSNPFKWVRFFNRQFRRRAAGYQPLRPVRRTPKCTPSYAIQTSAAPNWVRFFKCPTPKPYSLRPI